MVKLNNINKFYYKNKSNQIHVINDTSLSFPKTGLVCLLGPSGCGKTTLLNVIGGLDKIDSGEIIIDDVVINKYQPNKWDDLRNRHFGYIFQNYNLLPNLTVFQNLEFVLKMFNFKKEEVEERINYALSAVGMIKYKKRKPNQLSGGQQQRIAIARALVKSPNIVIADEPTGNLDEKNTTQIMNIIKKLSKECLVILVSHEPRLVNFYADYIIKVEDGKIVDGIKKNMQANQLTEIDDQNIYLQDLNKEESKSDNYIFKYFYQDGKVPELDINVIYKDNTFYMSANGGNIKIKFLDNTNEIKIVDAKKPIITHEKISDFDYYMPKISKDIKTSKSVISYKDAFVLSFKHLLHLGRRKKIVLLVFLLSAMMIVVGFINVFSMKNVDPKKYQTENSNIVEIRGVGGFNYNEINGFKQMLNVDHVLGPANQLRFQFVEIFIYNQFQSFKHILPEHSLLPIDVVKDPVVLYGRLPEDDSEIVIDKWIADLMLEDPFYRTTGVTYYEQLIDINYKHSYISLPGKIVGIVDTNNPNIYMTLKTYHISMLNHISQRGYNYYVDNDSFEYVYFDFDYYIECIKKIKPPEEFLEKRDLEKHEIVLATNFLSVLLVDGDYVNTLTIGNIEFTVIGFFEARVNEGIIISPDVIEELFFDYLSINNIASVYTLDKKETIRVLDEFDLIAIDIAHIQYETYFIENYSFIHYIFAVMVLIASLVFLYFIMRSNIIARIYEVGVFRTLGVRKSNIYRLFLTEIIILTVFTSVVGVLILAVLINGINNILPITFVYFPWYISVISIVFILISNISVGLIPVRGLLKLTPSQIISKYDI